MHQPGKGTWYYARFTVDESGECNARYDYGRIPLNPAFDEDLGDIRELLIEDQKMFPREPGHLPEWHPSRPQS
jgi:hypothetical protein